MITRVKIDGYKSFRDFELEMKPLMVIFGANASGKSNFLDALQLVSLAATEKSLKEAFEKHRGLPRESLCRLGEASRIKENNMNVMAFDLDVELTDSVCSSVEKRISELRKGLDKPGESRSKITERNLRYSLKLEVTEPTGFTRVIDEKLVALTKRRPHKERSRNPFLERMGNKIRVRMESQAHPMDKDAGLDYTLVSSRLYAPHHPHINAFSEEAEHWRFYYFEPKQLMREASPVKEVKYIGPRGEDLAGFIYNLEKNYPRKFDNINRAISMYIQNIETISAELFKEGFVRLSIKEPGGEFSPSLISEGTLRVLGMLSIFHSIDKPTVIGYEEPENGVHPARLKLIADLLRNLSNHEKVQVIVNTHSTEFVEMFSDHECFVCQKKKGVTSIEPVGDMTPLFRRQAIKEGLCDLSL